VIICCPASQRGAGGSDVLTGPRETGAANPTFQNYSSFNNNSHAQANSGIRLLLRSYTIWLHVEEASLQKSH